MGSVRLFIGIPLGAVVTVGLFLLMKNLIIPDDKKPEQVEEAPSIDITRPERDEEAQTEERELQRPDTPDEPPPPPPPQPQQTTRPSVDNVGTPVPQAEIDLGSISQGGVLDSDPQPIVRIPPDYPRRAAERGLEGWVLVEFTIAIDGTVKNPFVVESSNSIFERPALRAVARWKYKPQILNGEPIERSGVRVTIEFKLDEAQRRGFRR